MILTLYEIAGSHSNVWDGVSTQDMVAAQACFTHIVQDASCPCGAEIQSGDHVVWECSLHLQERRCNRMVGLEQWDEIGHLIWVVDEDTEDPNDRVDGVERFFDYHSYQF